MRFQDKFRRDMALLNKRVRDYNLNCPVSAQMMPFEVQEEAGRLSQWLGLSRIGEQVNEPMRLVSEQVRRAKRDAEARALQAGTGRLDGSHSEAQSQAFCRCRAKLQKARTLCSASNPLNCLTESVGDAAARQTALLRKAH